VERARQCKFTYATRSHREIPVLEEILKDAAVNKEQVAYIGDDLTTWW